MALPSGYDFTNAKLPIIALITMVTILPGVVMFLLKHFSSGQNRINTMFTYTSPMEVHGEGAKLLGVVLTLFGIGLIGVLLLI